MAHRASQSTSGRRAELSSVLHGGVACDVGMAGGVSGGVEGVEGDSARRRKVVRCVASVRAYNRWRRCSQPCGDSSIHPVEVRQHVLEGVWAMQWGRRGYEHQP